MLTALLGIVRRGSGTGARDALTLVLNGDVFDLDAPRVVGNESVFHDLPRNAEHASRRRARSSDRAIPDGS